jgi:hypothetical protein
MQTRSQTLHQHPFYDRLLPEIQSDKNVNREENWALGVCGRESKTRHSLLVRFQRRSVFFCFELVLSCLHPAFGSLDGHQLASRSARMRMGSVPSTPLMRL